MKLIDFDAFIQKIFRYKSQQKEEFEIEKILKKKINITLLNEKNILCQKTFENYLRILRVINENFENFVKRNKKREKYFFVKI